MPIRIRLEGEVLAFRISLSLSNRGRQTDLDTRRLYCRGRRFRVLWPTSRYLPPKIRAFVVFMAENLFAD